MRIGKPRHRDEEHGRWGLRLHHRRKDRTLSGAKGAPPTAVLRCAACRRKGAGGAPVLLCVTTPRDRMAAAVEEKGQRRRTSPSPAVECVGRRRRRAGRGRLGCSAASRREQPEKGGCVAVGFRGRRWSAVAGGAPSPEYAPAEAPSWARPPATTSETERWGRERASERLGLRGGFVLARRPDNHPMLIRRSKKQGTGRRWLLQASGCFGLGRESEQWIVTAAQRAGGLWAASCDRK
jgi:hypothetical protein